MTAPEKDHDPGDDVTKGIDYPTQLKGLNTFGGAQLQVFYAGDDDSAKLRDAELIATTGFRPLDAGPLKNARYLEPLAGLEIQLAELGLGTNFLIMFRNGCKIAH